MPSPCASRGSPRLRYSLGRSAAEASQDGQSALAQLPRTSTTSKAQPLARGCPLASRGEPSPPGCRREPALALWCPPKVADCSIFGPLGIADYFFCSVWPGNMVKVLQSVAPQLAALAAWGARLRAWAALRTLEEHPRRSGTVAAYGAAVSLCQSCSFEFPRPLTIQAQHGRRPAARLPRVRGGPPRRRRAAELPYSCPAGIGGTR